MQCVRVSRNFGKQFLLGEDDVKPDIFDRFRFRSSRPEELRKKGVFRNFRKLKGKSLCQSLFFHKFAGLRPATLLKREFRKFFKAW